MIAFRASLDREGQHQLRGVVSSRCHKLVSRLEVRLYFILYSLYCGKHRDIIMTVTNQHH